VHPGAAVQAGSQGGRADCLRGAAGAADPAGRRGFVHDGGQGAAGRPAACGHYEHEEAGAARRWNERALRRQHVCAGEQDGGAVGDPGVGGSLLRAAGEEVQQDPLAGPEDCLVVSVCIYKSGGGDVAAGGADVEEGHLGLAGNLLRLEKDTVRLVAAGALLVCARQGRVCADIGGHPGRLAGVGEQLVAVHQGLVRRRPEVAVAAGVEQAVGDAVLLGVEHVVALCAEVGAHPRE